MKRTIRNKIKKKLPKYALGTMKPVDLGYQQARGIGGFKSEVDPGLDISGETQAVKESILPNALGTIANYGTQVANNLKQGPVFNTRSGTITDPGQVTSTPKLDIDRNTLQTKGMPSTLPSTLTPSATVNIVPLMSIPGFLSNVSALAGDSSQQALQNVLSGTGFNTAGEAFSSSLTAIPQGGFQLSEGALNAANQQALQNATETAAKQGAGAATGGLGKIANIGGKALSVLGSAKGLYDMGSQIANAGDTRSASDMLNSSAKQYFTTDRGNSYLNYSGVNSAQELAYERAMKNAKQTNFALTSIGTGASIGSLFPGYGTIIGTAAGALVGALGSLFGFGNNKEKVEQIIRNTNDNIAGFNRSSEAKARSQDVKQEFYDRQGYAKEGKGAYGPMKYKKGKEDVDVLQGPNGYAVGKPTSMLAPGEYTYDPVNMTGSKVIGKGHEDTEPSYIEPNDLNIVFSDHLKIGNKSIAKHAAPMIKEMERLNKIIFNASQAEGLQEAQQQLLIQLAQQRQQQINDLLVLLSELQNVKRAEKEMKRYKCGKKPGYDDGKPESYISPRAGLFEYGLTALPSIAALISSKDRYHRAKHASTYAPSTYVDNVAGRRAINELAQLKFDPSQYLTDAQRAYNQANWQVNRNAGYGAGAQAIMRNANLQSYLNSLGQIRIAEQDANNKYRAAYADALAKYGAAEQEAMIRDNTQRFGWQLQQNAAKEYYMDTYKKNGLTALADLAHDIMGVRQYDIANAQKDRESAIYGDHLRAQDAAAAQEVFNAANANRAAYNQSRQSALKPVATSSSFVPTGFMMQNPFNDIQLGSKFDLDGSIARMIGLNNYKRPLLLAKCGKSGYEDGKPGYVLSDYVNSSGRGETVLSNQFFPTERSTKHITTEGDTTYTNAATPPVGFIESILGSNGVMRKKGESASPEYLKAKAYHEQMLRNVPLNSNKGYLQSLMEMFGFKCGKPAYKCGKSSKRKRC